MPHFTETFAICVIDGNGGGRWPTAPTRSPTEELVEFAKGCDLLLIEATLPRPERTGMRGHLTPEEAGEHARARGRQARGAHPHLRRARPDLGARPRPANAFGAPVEVAREGAVYEV